MARIKNNVLAMLDAAAENKIRLSYYSHKEGKRYEFDIESQTDFYLFQMCDPWGNVASQALILKDGIKNYFKSADALFEYAIYMQACITK